MAQELENLQREVQEMSDVVDSGVALLQELSQMIRDNAGDPQALQLLADDLDSKANELAAAIAANTPAEEPPVEPPLEPEPQPAEGDEEPVA